MTVVKIGWEGRIVSGLYLRRAEMLRSLAAVMIIMTVMMIMVKCLST